MQPPTTPKQVQAFLRLVSYYRKFIKGFAKIAKPLTLLPKQQVKFDWTPSHHKAFLTLKEEYKHQFYTTQTLIGNTLSTQMHLMMHAELNFHRNTMAQNSQ